MSQLDKLSYRIAETSQEMEQIYRLNYQTFVEEIPQHVPNQERQLIDRFNEENTYIIAKKEEEVVGMIAVRGKRPFSLDQKLDNVDYYLPEGANPCEIRLLSVKEAYRGGRTFYGLCEKLVSFCLKEGYNMALISGTDRQTKLYRHIGFQPFGPPVGTETARFQPMYLTKKSFESSSKVFQRLMKRETKAFRHSFLPGPVPVTEAVRRAWAEPPVSHRAASFQAQMKKAKERLQQLTKAPYVEVLAGTGTLANDAVAAQLSRLSGTGLILASGEFGERLLDHGERWELSFTSIRHPWDTPVSVREIEKVLARNPDISWLWTVHCETSTGYLYPLEELKEICREYRVRLCLDACSSLGVVPVDFSDVYLASSSSGKGLGSYPGLALVFHQELQSAGHNLPAYLDLEKYAANESVPFTHSSNGLSALNAALDQHAFPAESLASQVRRELVAAGMKVLQGNHYSHGILTVILPVGIRSRELGDCLQAKEIWIHYESRYLLEHNWVQLALMGEQKEKEVMEAVQVVIEQYKRLTKGEDLQK